MSDSLWSTPVFSVLHYLPKFARINVQWVSDSYYYYFYSFSEQNAVPALQKKGEKKEKDTVKLDVIKAEKEVLQKKLESKLVSTSWYGQPKQAS